MSACDVRTAGTIDLYFYDELPAAERAEVERHLVACARCREALAELGEIKAALAARPVIAGPPSGDWSRFMARLDAAIGHESAADVVPFLRAPARSHRYFGYLTMAALLALVTLSVIVAARWRSGSIDMQVARSLDVAPAPSQRNPEDVTALAALSEAHFERSKLVVLGLAAKDPAAISTADWAYERQLASRLLSDTRLYRMAAEDRGMDAVAGVMRDLELVLLEASMSDEADPAALPQLQRLIRKRDLVQKMSVVNTTGL